MEVGLSVVSVQWSEDVVACARAPSEAVCVWGEDVARACSNMTAATLEGRHHAFRLPYALDEFDTKYEFSVASGVA